MEYGKRL